MSPVSKLLGCLKIGLFILLLLQTLSTGNLLRTPYACCLYLNYCSLSLCAPILWNYPLTDFRKTTSSCLGSFSCSSALKLNIKLNAFILYVACLIHMLYVVLLLATDFHIIHFVSYMSFTSLIFSCEFNCRYCIGPFVPIPC